MGTVSKAIVRKKKDIKMFQKVTSFCLLLSVFFFVVVLFFFCGVGLPAACILLSYTAAPLWLIC